LSSAEVGEESAFFVVPCGRFGFGALGELPPCFRHLREPVPVGASARSRAQSLDDDHAAAAEGVWTGSKFDRYGPTSRSANHFDMRKHKLVPPAKVVFDENDHPHRLSHASKWTMTKLAEPSVGQCGKIGNSKPNADPAGPRTDNVVCWIFRFPTNGRARRIAESLNESSERLFA
jgi:hypothetical protein